MGTKLAIQLIFVVINITFALIQNGLRKRDIHNNTTGGIDHTLWAAIYGTLLVAVFFITHYDILMIIQLCVLRIVLFNPLFNGLEGTTFFHLGTESKIDVKIAPYYKIIYITCCVIFILINVKYYYEYL